MRRRTNRSWSATVLGGALMMFAGAIAAPAQTFTTLFSFHGPNGNAPQGAPIQTFNGNLYGTTVYGGTSNDGTIFKSLPAAR